MSIVTTDLIGELKSLIRALPPTAKHAWRARNNRSRKRVTILLTQYAHLRLRGSASGARPHFGHAVLHHRLAPPISEFASPTKVCVEAEAC